MSAAKPAPDRQAILGGSLALASAAAASTAGAAAIPADNPDAALLALGRERQDDAFSALFVDQDADGRPRYNVASEIREAAERLERQVAHRPVLRPKLERLQEIRPHPSCLPRLPSPSPPPLAGIVPSPRHTRANA